ncbi:MAG: FecR domain-containing protein [Burkholderiaceae bacterium]|jgi:transmembrane sensor|nr:FecR domain-containing protein [Burkholderiaceae bacterium]
MDRVPPTESLHLSGGLPPSAGRALQALGQPLAPAVARAAAGWFALLQSGQASDADRARWQRWLDEDAAHGRAWAHLQAVTGALPGLNAGGAGYQGLSAAPRAARRRLLGLLAGLGTAAGATWLASGTPQWQQMAADYSTGTQRRRWTLPDGTDMLLGPGSAVALHFDGTQRRLRLVAGQALFTTAHPPGQLGAQPFVVETDHGRVRALGTRFVVRSGEAGARVAVFEGAVELRPRAGASVLRLEAGQAVDFGPAAWGAPAPAGAGDDAWTHGRLWVDDQRLDDFLAELGRYRPGWLRAEPAVAGLRFSGVFPLDEGGTDGTDAVLAMLPGALPVQVRWRTRWWVVVEAAGR